MALIVNFTCITCHKDVEEAVSAGQSRNQCRECKNKELVSKRAQHLKGLEALTLEERIAKIEAWIYDYKFPINIYNTKY